MDTVSSFLKSFLTSGFRNSKLVMTGKRIVTKYWQTVSMKLAYEQGGKVAGCLNMTCLLIL